MRNNSTNHSRGIIDSTRGRVPGLHAYSEAEAILEQRMLFVSLCEARMAFTRLLLFVSLCWHSEARPYLSNDCSLFHCVRHDGLQKTIRNNSTNHSRGIIPEDECLACIHSEAEAILEQRATMLFVSLCEAGLHAYSEDIIGGHT